MIQICHSTYNKDSSNVLEDTLVFLFMDLANL